MPYDLVLYLGNLPDVNLPQVDFVVGEGVIDFNPSIGFLYFCKTSDVKLKKLPAFANPIKYGKQVDSSCGTGEHLFDYFSEKQAFKRFVELYLFLGQLNRILFQVFLFEHVECFQ